MGRNTAKPGVTATETIWGTELRILLNRDQAKDLAFIRKHGPVPEQVWDLLSQILGYSIRHLAWQVADGIHPVPFPAMEDFHPMTGPADLPPIAGGPGS